MNRKPSPVPEGCPPPLPLSAADILMLVRLVQDDKIRLVNGLKKDLDWSWHLDHLHGLEATLTRWLVAAYQDDERREFEQTAKKQR